MSHDDFLSEKKEFSEFETRKQFIDVDMKRQGWRFSGTDADVVEEYAVADMAGVPGKKGSVDYVLFDKDRLPLAVVEAKRFSKDEKTGQQQAKLYADCLERKFKRRPMMFMTNGFKTTFWDDVPGGGPPRTVSGIFSKDDLQKLMHRHDDRQDLTRLVIDNNITDRYYQQEAIRAVCERMMRGERRHLLVMATGKGKTRTASSLVDVLSRGKHVTNVLFLADRTALVKQARDDFKKYLPDLSLCNLCANKAERNARIVFSTYPTMLNAIDAMKDKDGLPIFSPAHFDLIIIDESHRSIFKKYRSIFEYFDAMLVGLTATPKAEVDRNTYEFFGKDVGLPSYAYDYETAVQQDHVLVPYYNYEVRTKFLEDGIVYDELSEEDKARYEEDFGEEGQVPEVVTSAALNKFVFNQTTVDTVIQDLMERGIKVAGGDRLGKTIIFAQNKNHAQYIVERFDELYPQYRGHFARRIICDDAYAQTIIDDFKDPERSPHIAVSVDMMDTGIDVPECLNLVFFKKVRSKTKFWQMIGRGTRLCRGLTCLDQIDGEYVDKRRFLIFDYCGNFEFFRERQEGFEGKEVKTLSEHIFGKCVQLLFHLQENALTDEKLQDWRQELADFCHERVMTLNAELFSVRLCREYVEKYRERTSFECLSEDDKGELAQKIAPLICLDDTDESAKRFDNFMYGLILEHLEKKSSFRQTKKRLQAVATRLERKASISQVKEKLQLIRAIQDDEFFRLNDTIIFEKV